ncbi:MAG: short-chain dehydrogenase [Paracoccaceae bacterium]|nr:MAG: short-chain dehydrogenase [Paracoccaceae bacterium]
MQGLSGRVAIVTGAGRGIGAAAARALADAGAAVVLAARDAAAVAAGAGAIAAAGGRALGLACDVADHDAVAALVARTLREFGRLDILVNNAAVIEPIGRMAETDPAAWGRLIDINVKGVYHGLRAAIPAMAGGGVVVNLSSGAATRPLEGWSAYCASKAAVLMLTRAADLEYGPRIRVVGLSPGTVATEMQVKIRASGINPVSRLDPSAHIPPEWAGRAVAWLCSDAAADLRGEDVSLRDPAIRARIGLG